MSFNQVILVGNLGHDPETRTFSNGGKVCNLRIATSKRWKDRSTGERRERTEWHNVAIYVDALVNVAEQYLSKGDKVLVQGALETRKWQDQNGQDRYSTEVTVRPYDGQLVMLGDGGGGGDGGKRQNDSGAYNPPSGVLDDEIPF